MPISQQYINFTFSTYQEIRENCIKMIVARNVKEWLFLNNSFEGFDPSHVVQRSSYFNYHSKYISFGMFLIFIEQKVATLLFLTLLGFMGFICYQFCYCTFVFIISLNFQTKLFVSKASFHLQFLTQTFKKLIVRLDYIFEMVNKIQFRCLRHRCIKVCILGGNEVKEMSFVHGLGEILLLAKTDYY